MSPAVSSQGWMMYSGSRLDVHHICGYQRHIASARLDTMRGLTRMSPAPEQLAGAPHLGCATRHSPLTARAHEPAILLDHHEREDTPFMPEKPEHGLQ